MKNVYIELPKSTKILYISTPNIPPTIYIKYKNSTLEIKLNTLFDISYRIDAENKRIEKLFKNIIKQL